MLDPLKSSILLLDPDYDFLEAVAELGKKKNLTIVAQPYSKREKPEIEELLFEIYPDIVVINLDQSDELTFGEPIQEILRVPMPIPPLIVGTTSNDSISLKTRAYLLGIDDYLVRPFTPADVWLRLDVHLRTRKLQRQLETATRKLSAVNVQLSSSNRTLEEMTLTDELTGLNNMRFMTQYMEKQFQLFSRYDRHFSIMMIDLDHFKEVNDKNDHLVGSETIKVIGHLISDATRGSDIKARYGGDEYIVAMPETDGPAAFLVGERIRSSISAYKLKGSHNNIFQVTSSIGIGTFEKSRHKIYPDIVRDADYALYIAKKLGRNRVELFSEKLVQENKALSTDYDETQSAVFTEIKKSKE
jgi:two-component system cell cycle response regulator